MQGSSANRWGAHPETPTCHGLWSHCRVRVSPPQTHLLCGTGSGWSLAPLLKWSCPAQWGWEQRSVPGAAFSVECSNIATGGARLLPTVATPSGIRLLASGPVSCAGLRPRLPGARKGAAMLPPGCADPWSGCLRSEVESLDGLRGSLWGQKRALRALQIHLVPSSLATGDRIYPREGMDS